MFLYVAACLITLVLVVLLYPLWRSAPRPLLMGNAAIDDEGAVNRSLERENLLQSLSQLEIDFTQGKVNPDDYHRFKLMEEHRLLNLLDLPTEKGEIKGATDHKVVGPLAAPRRGRSWGLIMAISIWIVAGTVAVRSTVYEKISRDQAGPAEGSVPSSAMPPINPEEMVARLKARLDKDPNDIQGQMMLGRSFMVLQRWPEAEAAWKKVLELDERSSMAHASLGEILLRSHPPGDKAIAEEALSHFDKALIGSPQNPSILWARGISLIALGRNTEADEAWTAAYQLITPGTEESKMLKSALDALRSGEIAGP